MKYTKEQEDLMVQIIKESVERYKATVGQQEDEELDEGLKDSLKAAGRFAKGTIASLKNQGKEIWDKYKDYRTTTSQKVTPKGSARSNSANGNVATNASGNGIQPNASNNNVQQNTNKEVPQQADGEGRVQQDPKKLGLKRAFKGGMDYMKRGAEYDKASERVHSLNDYVKMLNDLKDSRLIGRNKVALVDELIDAISKGRSSMSYLKGAQTNREREYRNTLMTAESKKKRR